MSRFTYYSPLWLGFLLTWPLKDVLSDNAPAALRDTPWVWVALLAVCAGVVAQLLMVGAQGAFAQVLPVPRGRSIRGRGAVFGGMEILAAAALAPITLLLRSEGLTTAATATAGAGGALALLALVTYVWCMPAAQQDFADER